MIGRQPARAAMTADDIGNNTIDSNKIINNSIVAADIGAIDASVMSGVMPVGVTGGSGLNAVSPANLASGVMPVGVTGGSGLDAVPAGTPDLDIVESVNPPYQSFGGTAMYTLDTIDIPSAGYWQIWSELRWGWYQRASWSKVGLYFLGYTSGSSNTFRMSLENPGQMQANANETHHYEWILEFYNGASFPQTVTLKLYSNAGFSSFFLQNDANGWNAYGAIKLKPSVNAANGARWVGY